MSAASGSIIDTLARALAVLTSERIAAVSSHRLAALERQCRRVAGLCAVRLTLRRAEARHQEQNS